MGGRGVEVLGMYIFYLPISFLKLKKDDLDCWGECDMCWGEYRPGETLLSNNDMFSG